MTIQVKFMSLLNSVTGTAQVELEPVYRTVGELLVGLSRQFPALGREIFDEDGKLDYLYQVVLNGEKIPWEETWDTPVPDGSRISIFAVMGGG
ncbi:MAG: MoaD/ThiS family protein [Firmicutes bacterium]|nr:MoaD/ThiS family protein [Bacillota bacterium]